ncbi:MAG TPA: hypothetical protein VLF94_01930 [Chlamydiales bacterium]|nr:hypothetical protein [Chlamydiales bacterium]
MTIDQVNNDVKVIKISPYPFSYATPPSYSEIATKTLQNGGTSLATLVLLPVGCISGAAFCLAGAVAVSLTLAAVAAGGVIAGAMQLAATPIIAAKDLAHHTWRVLRHDESQQKSQAT